MHGRPGQRGAGPVLLASRRLISPCQNFLSRPRTRPMRRRAPMRSTASSAPVRQLARVVALVLIAFMILIPAAPGRAARDRRGSVRRRRGVDALHADLRRVRHVPVCGRVGIQHPARGASASSAARAPAPVPGADRRDAARPCSASAPAAIAVATLRNLNNATPDPRHPVLGLLLGGVPRASCSRRSSAALQFWKALEGSRST